MGWGKRALIWLLYVGLFAVVVINGMGWGGGFPG